MKLMHKYIASFCFASILILGAGCSSTKQNESAGEEADSYISEEEENEVKVPKKTSSKTSKKSSKSSFADLFKSKFVTVDQTTIYTPQMFGGIKQTDADIIYYPKMDTYGFSSSFKAVYYYLTFDDTARNALIKAVDRYFADFENKKLSRSEKKTEKAYGKIKSRIFWGSLKGNTPNNGEGTISLGYQFVEKSPYFSLTMYPADNDMYDVNSGNDEKSMKLEYFFTKNQAKMLAEALKDENLELKLREVQGEEIEMIEENDDYSDDYDIEEEDASDDVEEVDGE